MSDNTFCKTFEVDGYQVVAMTMGDGENPDTTAFLQATLIDGIHFKATMDVPYKVIDEAFTKYDESQARRFLEIGMAALEGTAGD